MKYIYRSVLAWTRRGRSAIHNTFFMHAPHQTKVSMKTHIPPSPATEPTPPRMPASITSRRRVGCVKCRPICRQQCRNEHAYVFDHEKRACARSRTECSFSGSTSWTGRSLRRRASRARARARTSRRRSTSVDLPCLVLHSLS